MNKIQLKNTLLEIYPNEKVVLMEGHMKWEVKRGELDEDFVYVGMQGFELRKFRYDFGMLNQDKEIDNIIQSMEDQKFSIMTAGLTY
ncbi:hypothetical protein [Priestia megaterium]|uniref:hypothetical protein n=1 Tax=Priestia megaterium TaxID=1404 RepID=UPI00112E8256|nr:hypothetical protein [Priestia megaterium]TPF17971.1 hypothetical protein CBE78_01735 [Priestia megaterium]TPF22079.1 hypothetical protein CBE79_04240 [Priestia megaterium]